jgi:hypothetical protein
MTQEIQDKMYDLRDAIVYAKDLKLAEAEWWNLWDLLNPEEDEE